MAGVVTGEAVPLDLRPARVPSRLLAELVDVVVVLLLVLASAWLFSRAPVELDPAAEAALGTALLLALVVGYPTLWETLTRGRTPGKAALGLRVVRDDGGPVRFRHALSRALVLLVDLPLLHLPSLLAQVLTERGKGVGDLLAGTFVVAERVPAAATPPAPVMPPPLADWAAGLDLSRMPDHLALAVRQFLGRAPSLAPASREALGSRLASAVAATTSPPPPPGTPGWAYLAAVLAERRRRAEERLGLARPPGAGRDDGSHGPATGGGPSGTGGGRPGPGVPAADATPTASAPPDAPRDAPGGAPAPGGFALPG